MIQYTIYEHPTDAPEWYVIRRRTLLMPPGKPKAEIILDPQAILAPNLTAAREAVVAIDPTLVCIERDPSDEPQIVETWL